MSGTVATLYLNSLAGPAERALAADIAALEATLKERSRMNYSAAELAEFREAELHKVSLKHWGLAQARAAELREQIADHAAAYQREAERDATRNLLELTRATTRLRGLSDQALEAEAQAYLGAEAPEQLCRRPDSLEALAAELKARDRTTHYEALTKKMAEAHYTEPHRYAGRGPELYAALELAESEYGEFRLRDENGGLQRFAVGELLQGESK